MKREDMRTLHISKKKVEIAIKKFLGEKKTEGFFKENRFEEEEKSVFFCFHERWNRNREIAKFCFPKLILFFL